MFATRTLPVLHLGLTLGRDLLVRTPTPFAGR
jgi:hypothetical protein